MLKAHFINVGKGCCTAIEFPSGRLGIIDVDDSRTLSVEEAERMAPQLGMNTLLRFGVATLREDWLGAMELVEKAYKASGRALTDPITYIQDEVCRTSAFRFMLTHPDMDHMSGIKRLYDTIPFENFWDTDNNKTIDPNSWASSPYRKEDWDAYQNFRPRTENPKGLRILRNCTGEYWTSDGIEILAPTAALIEKGNESGDYNHLSYVLKVSHAGTSIIMGGDATTEVWADILSICGEERLKCDILFAPHHGSEHNFHKEAVEAMDPSLVIVSVASGTDYAYQQYSAIADEVLSTKWCGNIVVSIDDLGTWSRTTQYNLAGRQG